MSDPLAVWNEGDQVPHQHVGSTDACFCDEAVVRQEARVLQVRFDTENDFMLYTHDVLDMHRGLMIRGCIYCSIGD